MGLRVTTNGKGEYQLYSTIVDEKIHEEEFVSEAEAKKLLVNRQLWDFIQEIVKIEMTFPHNYGSLEHGRFFDKAKSDEYYKFMDKATDEELYDKGIAILRSIGLEVKDVSDETGV